MGTHERVTLLCLDKLGKASIEKKLSLRDSKNSLFAVCVLSNIFEIKFMYKMYIF